MVLRGSSDKLAEIPAEVVRAWVYGGSVAQALFANDTELDRKPVAMHMLLCIWRLLAFTVLPTLFKPS